MLESLCKLKYKQEITKSNVNFLIETVPIHLSVHPPFDSHSLVRAPIINSLHKPYLQQELYIDYKKISERARTNQLNVYTKTLENQMYYLEKQLNQIVDKVYKINSSIQSTNEHLSSIMLNMIDQHLNNITAYIQSIYKFNEK